jgi:RNA polymerase sigma-70 factor (ECF subfamily)
VPPEDDTREREAELAFVERLKARDEAAFNELVELYERRVFALLYRMLGRKEEAEDITQETFVQVFRKIDGFRGDAKLSTWLFRVAVNLCKNQLKYSGRRGRGAHQDFDSVAEHVSLGGAEGVSVGSVARPDELAEGMQLEVIVKIAITHVDEEFRHLVILRDVEDLSYEEIADVTGLPRGTVKSRIHRGRAQLRAKVEKMLGTRLPTSERGSGKGKKT